MPTKLLQKIRAGGDTPLRKRDRQRRGIGHYAQVAAQRQVESSAMRVTVDHGDNRLRHRAHACDDQRPAALALDVLFYRIEVSAIRFSGIAHAAQIVAGAERPSGAGQDHDANFRRPIAILERLQQFDADAYVKRVQTLRTVERHATNLILLLYK